MKKSKKVRDRRLRECEKRKQVRGKKGDEKEQKGDRLKT